MSVTLSQSRTGNTTTVVATSTLTGTVYFHWFQDTRYLGFTTTPRRTFYLSPGNQSVIDVVDSNSSAQPTAPAQYPARRVLSFIRSSSPTIAKYRIEQQQNGGGWTAVGVIADNPGSWVYNFTTPRLVDLSTYAWRVVPMDAAGNDGTPVMLSGESIVRTPDAPTFSATFSGGRATFQ